MEFKPAKSRSLVLRRGLEMPPPQYGSVFALRSERTSSQCSKRNRPQQQAECEEMLIQAETWMTSLEKSGLPGKYKAWGIPTWGASQTALATARLPISTVCSIGLYSTGSKLQLPVTSMVEEFAKTCQAMMLLDSQDARVCQADIEVRTGREWSGSRALREAEDRLHHANIVRVSSPGQVRPGLLHQGKLGQGQLQGEVWHGAEGGPQGRVGKMTCQGCSHEQAGQLDKVGECARKGTDLAEHLEHGRTPDQVSAVFHV
ncbi:hypothetical protein N1851_024592 [Merluccius polli]|uniref:Uncharacterized protein n=1 Tax=Merluccius polli TaxID=89951 RepID=A0AA47NUB6_MERPO|nr:hypothetical protein N1851_024592 [Merluccius polli]